jgi:truncated hemoglobin YjbI
LAAQGVREKQMDKSLTVGCPKCDADRGKPCVDPKGNALAFTHDERDAWLKSLEDAAFSAVVDREL